MEQTKELKTQAEAKSFAETAEVTGSIEDGILTIRVPVNAYKNERGTVVVGSSFGKFLDIAGAEFDGKKTLFSFTAIKSSKD